MAQTMTFEEVKVMVARLSCQDQLKLAAHLNEKLGGATRSVTEQEELEEVRRNQLRLAEELLAECADVKDDSLGSTDAVAILRQMRDDRTARLCPSDA